MSRLKKGVTFRRLQSPYTRKSKYRELNFVRAIPASKIVRYDMGDATKKFSVYLDLISKETCQLRHNAIESARLTCVRHLEKLLGKTGFHMKLRIYPHHILRENPIAAGAGADRISTGMSHAFGKPIGLAARVFEGQVIVTIGVDKQNKDVARQALKRVSYKLPYKYSIV